MTDSSNHTDELQYIRVEAHPKAKKDLITRLTSNSYRIQTKAPAQDNRANSQITTILADYLRVDQKRLKLIKGHRNRKKMFYLESDPEEV